MSSLSKMNQAKMEDVFKMQGGYVNNHSNQSFRNLIIKATGIDVYDGEYENGWYPSKAKKLRRFVEIESDENVGKVLLALLDERDTRIQSKIEIGDIDSDPFEKFSQDLRAAAISMIGGQQYASNEERLNADLATARAVLNDLVFSSQIVCNNALYNQNTRENSINDYFRDLLKAKGYEQVLDQSRHGISVSGKDAGSVDLLMRKGNREVAIIEALRLTSVDTGTIKEHIDKAVTNYNALGTPTFLLFYAGSSDFGDFWRRLLIHLKQYSFEIECKRAIGEKVHPNASTRVCDCILSRDGYDFPVTFLAINVYK
ncbi:MAG: hypothetical protein GX218_00705 [Clostridiaceae bacterium]|nr:hypothetical protein [Clostridiaceae bacterium]